MEQATRSAPIRILLVEDNQADVRMTREALNVARIACELHVVSDGEQALSFLRRQPPYGDAPAPDLVLLDLSLPKVNGHKVLKELRAAGSGKRIPVVVLSGSKLSEDIERSFALDADEHIVKPAGLLQYASELMFAVGLVRPRPAA